LNRYEIPDVLFTLAAYCGDCGATFPWTSRAIEASKELAIVLNIQENDRNELPELIENLVRQTPRTSVAAIKLRALLQKTGPLAMEGFKQILIGVVTEGAKKLVWP
jgi:hypothetical protein